MEQRIGPVGENCGDHTSLQDSALAAMSAAELSILFEKKTNMVWCLVFVRVETTPTIWPHY